ncbi:unnamed protein product [Cylicocyclus nassatus]|uniref:Uncharacterized protein n=1 Tax=Cylicocyclus nassatus TaxID=53992 RepID=A0AA36GYV9_CYLNA|nr:unnamed protein product [Cylicocyclus nassatus]
MEATGNSTKKAQKKRGRKRRRNAAREDNEYVESVKEVRKLKEKFSSSKRKAKDDDMAYLKVSSSSVPKIRNSETHNNLLKRAEEAQINRIFQIDIRPDALQTLWMCALCHQRSAQDELGDLFGPYYVNIRPEGQWPSFLFKKSLKVTFLISHR